MAIRTIFTKGYGNGTFNGTIKEVVTKGYTIGEAQAGQNFTKKQKGSGYMAMSYHGLVQPPQGW